MSDDIPEGLDEFLSSDLAIPAVSPPMAAQDSASPGSDVPEGLDEFVAEELKHDKFSTIPEKLKTAAEGVAQGIAGPAATALEVGLGIAKPEDILARQQANPITHYTTEAVGLIVPAVVTAGESMAARTALGEAAAQMAKYSQASLVERAAGRIVPEASASLASKIGTSAAKAAVENALIAGGDEASRMILQDPDTSVETAVTTMGLSGLLGGVLGGAVPASKALWKATVGNKASKLVADMKGAAMWHVNNPDPVQAMTKELGEYFGEIEKVGSETFGEKGIKATAISKALPKEITEPMMETVVKVNDKVAKSIETLKGKGDSFAGDLEEKLIKFNKDTNGGSPETMYNALNSLKQSLQEDSRYLDGITPLSERAYRRSVKELAHDVKIALEDTAVWGNAGEIQSSINNSFSDWLKSTKDFRQMMTGKVSGESTVDAGKVATYWNQRGKPNAEIKMSKLKKFIDDTERLKSSISKAYESIGEESPIADVPLHVTLHSLGEETLGAKVVDALFGKMLSHAGGTGVGAGVGIEAAGAIGMSKEIGAIVGAEALGPFFSSILPGIAKALISKDISSSGFKSTVDYANAVVRGESLISKSSKAVFKAEGAVLSENLNPKESDRAKLNKIVIKSQTNPEALIADSTLGHYMPEHSGSTALVSARALEYLNSIRPSTQKLSPLDSTPRVNPVEQAAYNNALTIAQQPLVVLDRIKKGTLTANDIQALDAMYPKLVNRLRSRLNDEMVNHLTKGQDVPYKTRVSLSMFMGQPLDSTMLPSSIQSTQSSFAPPGAAPQSQAPQKGVKSSPSLQKMPGLYQTNSQSKESNRNK